MGCIYIEIIRKINGFEGYYISNLGKVYCTLGKGNRRNGNRVPMYEIKPRPNKNGYLRVYMREDKTNKRKDRYVHRLVAEHFISKENNQRNVVNHIDCNVQNNNVENLEWVTQKENVYYSMELGRLDKSVIDGKFISGIIKQ